MKKTILLLAACLPFASLAQNTNPAPYRMEQAQPQAEQAPDMAQLAYQAQDTRESIESRKEALRALGQQPSQNGLVAVARALKDENAALREAAIIGTAPYQLPHRWKMLEPLLSDEVNSVRLSATASLISDYHQFEPTQKEAIAKPLSELLAFLPTQDDFVSQLMYADILRWTGDHKNAEKHYLVLQKAHPQEPQVWLNLSDNYRAQAQDEAAISLLQKAIDIMPDNGDLYYAKSLALVRLEHRTIAAEDMHKAANLAQTNSYYWYLDGVLQEPLDLELSIASFEQAYMLSGSSEHLYAVCDIYVRNAHKNSEVCLDALAQRAPATVIEQLKAQAKH
ncbi:hypothetical protein RCJ22_14290 [Vibrio sp. FNV 38]|nr:hypothetical protein [Vibrio sp. FNV 38]